MEQYLRAVVAEPYNNYTWRGLQYCCQTSLLKPWVQAAKLPGAEVKPGKDGKPQIVLPEKFTPLDLLYAGARAKWQTENPGSGAYRQTVDEEIAALRALLALTAELKEGDRPLPDETAAALKVCGDALAQLKEIDASGLLAAHVLLFRANQDIAADYAKYRDENPGKVREYLVKFYLHLP